MGTKVPNSQGYCEDSKDEILSASDTASQVPKTTLKFNESQTKKSYYMHD